MTILKTPIPQSVMDSIKNYILNSIPLPSGLKMKNNLPIDSMLNIVVDSNGNESTLKLSTADSSFAGNVGIGTETPFATLHVKSGSTQIQIEGDSGSPEAIFCSGGNLIKYNPLLDLFVIGNGNLSISSSENRATFVNPIGVGTDTPEAAIDIVSTTQGFLIPRMTQAEILNLAVYVGLQAYNLDQNVLCFYDGTAWKKINHSNM